MNAAKSSPPWYAPWRHSARPKDPTEPIDLADLGTAFGLDLATLPYSGKVESSQGAEDHGGEGWVQRPGWRKGRRRGD